MNFFYGQPRLTSVAFYIPNHYESNIDLLQGFGIEESFLKDKIGFIKRAIKSPLEKASDLCCYAFDNLLKKYQLRKSDIKILIVVTQNPDKKIPHTAAIVHNKLQLESECMTFDISQGCSGYVHALVVASSLLSNFKEGKALIFTSDPYSEIVNPNSKNEALLFGDAASVSVISFNEPGYVIGGSCFGTAPNSNGCLECILELKMSGAEVFGNVMRYVIPSVKSLLHELDKSNNDIDLFLLHQGSKYIVTSIRENLNIENHKAPFIAEEYGNTVSSSIPICLESIFLNEQFKTIFLSGFGVGFSWGNCILYLV